MATIEESAVFEYYSNVFKELQVQDGGYFPSKHDPIALSKTAEHFNIAENEASRIFDDLSKQAADLEISKIRKLPPTLRQQFMRQRAHDILCNNKDLPFYKVYGEASSELGDPIDAFQEEYATMVQTLASSGWTIPLSIDIKRFDELKANLTNDESIDDFFYNYYAGKELRYIFRKAKEQIPEGAQRQTFEECYNSYMRNNFNICRVALLTVLERMISSFNSDPKDVRVMHVCDSKSKEERAKGNQIKSLCWASMYEFTKILYQKSDFSNAEPKVMNRHWLEHGRSSNPDDGIGCLKLFNAISTISHIKKNS